MKIKEILKWGRAGTLKIVYSKVMFGDTSIGKNKVIRTFIADTITQYKTIHTTESPGEQIDKIPVWIFWWQGKEQMPELVEICYNSIVGNLSDESCEVCLVTKENISSYIEIPKDIWNKFTDNKITITHFSDILRFCLLRKYGGLWIDATYYLAAEFSCASLKSEKLYTQKFQNPITTKNNNYIWGRWAGNLLYLSPGSKLASFMVDAFTEYWKKNDSLIEYYLIDHLLRIAYDEFEDIHELFERCAPNNQNVHKLSTCINEKFDPVKWRELIADTVFFKLNTKQKYITDTVDKELTFYGQIKKRSHLYDKQKERLSERN